MSPAAAHMPHAFGIQWTCKASGRFPTWSPGFLLYSVYGTAGFFYPKKIPKLSKFFSPDLFEKTLDKSCEVRYKYKVIIFILLNDGVCTRCGLFPAAGAAVN